MVKNPSWDIEPSEGVEMGLETSSEVTHLPLRRGGALLTPQWVGPRLLAKGKGSESLLFPLTRISVPLCPHIPSSLQTMAAEDKES